MSLASIAGTVAGIVSGVGQAVSIGANMAGADTSEVSALEYRALQGDAAAYQQLQQLKRSSNVVTAFAAAQAVARIDARRKIGGAVGTAASGLQTVAGTAAQAAAGAQQYAEDVDPTQHTPTLTWVLLGGAALVVVLLMRKR
jgi:hypothetical protein